MANFWCYNFCDEEQSCWRFRYAHKLSTTCFENYRNGQLYKLYAAAGGGAEALRKLDRSTFLDLFYKDSLLPFYVAVFSRDLELFKIVADVQRNKLVDNSFSLLHAVTSIVTTPEGAFYYPSKCPDYLWQKVRYLVLDLKVDVNVEDDRGRNCLFYALGCLLEPLMTEMGANADLKRLFAFRMKHVSQLDCAIGFFAQRDLRMVYDHVVDRNESCLMRDLMPFLPDRMLYDAYMFMAALGTLDSELYLRKANSIRPIPADEKDFVRFFDSYLVERHGLYHYERHRYLCTLSVSGYDFARRVHVPDYVRVLALDRYLCMMLRSPGTTNYFSSFARNSLEKNADELFHLIADPVAVGQEMAALAGRGGGVYKMRILLHWTLVCFKKISSYSEVRPLIKTVIKIVNNRNQNVLHYMFCEKFKYFDSLFFRDYETVDLDFVKCVIAEGLDVDAQDDNGDTVLHIAARNFSKKSSLCKFLIDAGAHPDVRNNRNVIAYECERDVYSLKCISARTLNTRWPQSELRKLLPPSLLLFVKIH